jgi:phage terminase small subunit
MGGIELQIWTEVVSGADSEHFQASDAPLLAAYCRAAALERRAAEELAVSAVAHGAPSPWLAVHKSAVHSLMEVAVKLRLTPKARTPGQRAGKRGPPPSYYDMMDQQRGKP